MHGVTSESGGSATSSVELDTAHGESVCFASLKLWVDVSVGEDNRRRDIGFEDVRPSCPRASLSNVSRSSSKDETSLIKLRR